MESDAVAVSVRGRSGLYEQFIALMLLEIYVSKF